MKKIYAQKQMFLFMNCFSALFLVLGLYGGLTVDKSWLYILFLSLLLLLLSTMFLINRIYYDKNYVKFSFIYRKETVKYEDIKEIYVQYNLFTGAQVIFNLDKKVEGEASSYLEYSKTCKKENIKNIFFTVGLSRKDLFELLQHCHCEKLGFHY